jgi:oxygen-independent coproporphyrinogen-3 oxidase
MNAVVESIIKEIEIQYNYLEGEPINTIYFGGGTPSMLSKNDLDTIFKQLHCFHKIAADAEITLEANPDDLSEAKLRMLKSTPVNRLSIGVQSFFDEDLKFMNRAHNADEAYNSIQLAQSIGFENITLDLIYGTPTMSNNRWQANLEKAFSLNVPHISCYCLTVEPKTALANMIEKGRVADVDENMAITQFEELLNSMKRHGYTQYEISNFCRDNNYSKHNSNYWLKQKYLGIGPSAHSFNGISRQWNVSNNAKYIKAISDGNLDFEKEKLTVNQQFNEYVLTSLRTIWGCDLKKIQNDFGSEILNNFVKQSAKYFAKELMKKINNCYILTDKGKLMADAISADLFIN